MSKMVFNRLEQFVKEHPMLTIIAMYGILATAIHVIYRRDKPLLLRKPSTESTNDEEEENK
jgi:hypothetical protein